MQSAASLLVAIAAAGVAAQTSGPETGKLGNATVVTNNPQGAVYVATLPEAAWTKLPGGGNIKGHVTAVAAPGGRGVIYRVHLTNLPEGGPFMYHLHDQPVPADGNCTKTLAHLDPFIRGEVTQCNPALPETCQVGDLSGKFGNITAPVFDQTYLDLYSATVPGIGAFFGNRSVVIHYPNKTRITCANFKLVADAGSATPTELCPNGTYTVQPTGGPTNTPPKPTFSVVPASAPHAVAATVWSVGAVAMLSALTFML